MVKTGCNMGYQYRNSEDNGRGRGFKLACGLRARSARKLNGTLECSEPTSSVRLMANPRLNTKSPKDWTTPATAHNIPPSLNATGID